MIRFQELSRGGHNSNGAVLAVARCDHKIHRVVDVDRNFTVTREVVLLAVGVHRPVTALPPPALTY